MDESAGKSVDNVAKKQRAKRNTWTVERMPLLRKMNDIFKVKGARSKMALLSSKEGALIELQQCEVPEIQKTPPENLRYGHTGFHELGLMVDDIDAFFAKVRAAGYETQTDYVWQCANIGRSFLFYDKDGNMIQIWQHMGDATWK